MYSRFLTQLWVPLSMECIHLPLTYCGRQQQKNQLWFKPILCLKLDVGGENTKQKASMAVGLTLEPLTSLTSSGPLMLPDNLLNFSAQLSLPISWMTLTKWPCLLFPKKAEAISKELGFIKELGFSKTTEYLPDFLMLVPLLLLLFKCVCVCLLGLGLAWILKVHCSSTCHLCLLYYKITSLYGSFPWAWQHIYLLS